MVEPMRTSGVRLASLFREVGLIAEPEWNKYFKKSKGLTEVLFQDVSWQTFVDLAKVEIRLPTGSRKPSDALPVELTKPLHVQNDEILEMLEQYHPDPVELCNLIAQIRPAVSGKIEDLLKEHKSDPSELYRKIVEEGVLTPDFVAEHVQKGHGRAIPRNRRLLAIEILALNGLISGAVRDGLVGALRTESFDLGQELAKHGKGWSKRIAESAAEGMALPTVDVTHVTLDEKCRNFCPVSLVRRELILPIEVDGIVRLAMSDPLNLSIPDLLASLTDRTILPCYAAPTALIGAINRAYPQPPSESPIVDAESPVPAALPAPLGKTPAIAQAQPMKNIVDSMSAVELVTSLVESAVTTKATDVHLEPNPQGMRVRYRIDGTLHTVMNIPTDVSHPVVSRIKVLSNMDVTERRRPQDGHFALEMGGHSIDFRVSAMPSYLGEKVVLRILDHSTVLKGLGELGLNESQTDIVANLVKRPYGLILVTGPTGGGKTTTLYSALNTINRPNINVITIEDPVEYQLEGITQINVDYGIDLDFASGLRSSLRQDPDVIMVGEVRDPETARIAIRAALTGHLVFSTLHTNTAVGAVAALTHMGVKPYLIASAVSGVVAQRLVKKICEECKEPKRVTKGLRRDLGLPENSRRKIYHGAGCSACLNTGYSGRTGVFEVLRITEAIRRLIIEQAGDEQILETATTQNFFTLRDHGIEKMFDGITSPEEIMRVVFLND